MSLNLHQKRLIAFIMVIILAIFEIIGFVLTYKYSGLSLGGMFKMYTIDSNVLSLVGCIVVLPFLYKATRDDNYVIPKFVRIIRYVTSCCLILTFLVCLFILGPVYRSWIAIFFGPSGLFYHLLCPIFSLLSYLFFEESMRLSPLDTLCGLAPTLLYGAILTIFACALGWGSGAPYFFFRVYDQPIWASILWFIGLNGFDYGICWMIWGFDKLTSHPKGVVK